MHLAVINGAISIPGAKNCLDGKDQLLFDILREGFTLFSRVDGLEFVFDPLQVVGVQIEIGLDAAFFFDGLKCLLVMAAGDAHDHVRKHHDEAAVAVKDKTAVARKLGQSGGHLIVEAQIQYGVHHPGH